MMDSKRQAIGISPAPIFRKRPRQALLAHPNNANAVKGLNRSSLEQQNHPQGLNPINPIDSRQFPTGWRDTQIKTSESNQYLPNPFGVKQTSFRPQIPEKNQPRPIGMTNQYQPRGIPVAQGQIQPSSNGPYPQTSPHNQVTNRPTGNRPHLQHSATYTARFQPRPTTTGQCLPAPPLRPRLTGYTGYRSQVMTPANNSNSLLFGDPKITSKKTVQPAPAFTQEWGTLLGLDSSMEDNVLSNETGTTQFKQAFGAQSVKTKRNDDSLKLITATIQDVRLLSQHKSSVAVLFEIMGIVNSAISYTGGSICREFLLKEDRDTINCVFYEIDREMTKITRGQWCRCVGSISSNGPRVLFKCVSVRPANNTEKQYRTRFAEKCKTTVREILAQKKEM